MEDEKQNYVHYLKNALKSKYQSFATVSNAKRSCIIESRQELLQRSVPIREEKSKTLYTKTTVEIFYKYNRIAIHPRNYKPYDYTTIAEHLASTHQFVADWSASRFIDWANSIDQAVADYIIQIIESRNHPEQAYKSCLGILNFEKKVGKQRLINACKRALDFRIYSFKAIQNILENNLDNAENEQEEEFELPNHNNIRGKNYYK